MVSEENSEIVGLDRVVFHLRRNKTLISEGSEEEKNWRRQNPKGYSLRQTSFTTGTTPVHKAATVGDSQSIKTLLKDKAHLVNARDINGWMPLHVSSFRFMFLWNPSLLMSLFVVAFTGSCQGWKL